MWLSGFLNAPVGRSLPPYEDPWGQREAEGENTLLVTNPLEGEPEVLPVGEINGNVEIRIC